MTAASDRSTCVTCKKDKLTYPCGGCSNRFCLDDLLKHRKDLSQELDHLQNDHDQLRQDLNDQKSNPRKHSIIKQIDRWEEESIDRIKQTAQQCRDKWINYSGASLLGIEKKLNDLAGQIKEMSSENEYNETDLSHVKQRLETLQEEVHRPTNVSIKEQSTSFINKISLQLLSRTGNIFFVNESFSQSESFLSSRRYFHLKVFHMSYRTSLFLFYFFVRFSFRPSLEKFCNYYRRRKWSRKSIKSTLSSRWYFSR